MDRTYWHKQTTEPLFPDIAWSRPQNKRLAGKLLIIGGNLHGFAAPASAYQETLNAGVGTSKVLLPDALKKTVGGILENCEYAPSTPSGSFSKKALAEWIDFSDWADGVLLAGDLGQNSETAVTVEDFTGKTSKQITIAKDAVDYFYNDAKAVLQRDNTTLVLSMAQLQKLCIKSGWHKPVLFRMDLLQLIDALHELTAEYPSNIVTHHKDNLIVAVDGQVSTTKVGDQETWIVKTASHCAVWWMQNPTKPFEALTTATSEL